MKYILGWGKKFFLGILKLYFGFWNKESSLLVKEFILIRIVNIEEGVISIRIEVD